jgi:hypothetical protein
MAGDITQPKRPRYESNERFDTVDANAASIAVRAFDDAQNRALLATPRITAGTPTGLIVTGLSLTPNPTFATDTLVRINTELGVAFDANGRTIIKPAGSTIDTVIPVGTFQIYIYYVDNSTDNAKRRFLPAAPPFVEFTQAINTAFQGSANVYLRAGSIGTAVAEDVVNGATTPLCLIGIATNPGSGAITITGWSPTAPNGTDITNRLSTVAAPSLVPATNTVNGSPRTLHDLITAVLYTAGQTAWLGSDFLTPAAGNNFGAYTPPAGGADKAFRQALGWVTIGNGTTVKGDFNTSDYANSNLLLAAAFTSLPASGGVIVLKRGVTLSNFGGAPCVFPAKSVEIIGDHTTTPSTLPHITLAAAESFTCSGTGSVTLRNLHIRFNANAFTLTTSPFKAFNVYMESVSTGGGSAFVGVNVSDLALEDIRLTTVLTAASTTGQLLQITGTAHRVTTRRLHYATNTAVNFNGRMISISDVRSDVSLEDTTYEPTTTSVGGGSVVFIDSTDSTTIGEFERRLVKGLYIKGDYDAPMLYLGDGMGQLTVEDVSTFEFTHAAGLIFTNTTWAGAGPMRFRRLYTGNNSNGVFIGGAQTDCIVEDSRFFGLVSQFGTSTIAQGRWIIRNCHFQRGTLFGLQGNQVLGSSIDTVLIEGCHFEDSNTSFSANVGACIQVVSTGTIEAVTIRNNTVNHTHFGLNFASAIIPNLFCVRADYCGAMLCQGNTAYHVMGFTAGGAKRAPYFLKCTSGNGTTNASFQWGTITVQDNTIGAALDNYCALYTHTFICPDVVTIKGNTVDTIWDTTVGRPLIPHVILFVYATNFTIARITSINNNDFNIRNPGITTITNELIFTIATLTFLGTWSFADNNVSMSAGGVGFTVGILFTIQASGIISLKIWNNQALRNSSGHATWLRTSFNVAPVRNFPNTVWVPPGAGVAWPNNDHIYAL